MAWNVLQQASTAATATGASSVSATYGSNVSSGSKLIAFLACSSAVAGKTFTAADGGGNSMTLVAESSIYDSTTYGAFFAMDTPAGDVGTTPTITATLSAGTGQLSLVIIEVSGLAVGNTLAAMLDPASAVLTENPHAGATTLAVGSVTTEFAGEFLVSFIADDGGPVTDTQPSGWTISSSAVNGSSHSNCVPAWTNSTGGTESGTWSFSATTAGEVCWTVAFLLTGEAPPDPEYTVIQSAKGTSTGSNTVTATFGTNLSAGSKLMAFIGANKATTFSVSSVKDTAGNSFTQLFTPVWSSPILCAAYAMDTPAADVGGVTTVTATFSTTASKSMVILEVAGLLTGNTTGMLDGTPAQQAFAAGASHAQPAYSSTTVSEFLVAFGTDDGGPQTMAQPAGYTLDPNSVNTNSTADCCVAYKGSTGGAETGTWTFTGTTIATYLAVLAFRLSPRPFVIRGLVLPPLPAPPPPGQIIGVPPAAAITRAATLSGSGTLTAAPGLGGLPLIITPVIQPPAPLRPPPSQIAAVAQPVTTAAAILSGSGTLAAGPGVGGLPLVTTPVVQPAQPAQPRPGQIVAFAPGAFTAAASLSGSGTLTAAPYFSAAAVLSGTGTLTAAYTTAGAAPYVITPVVQPAQPAQPRPGLITGVTLTAAFTAAATLTGSGTLTAAPYFSAAAALSGAGTLGAAYTTAGAPPYVVTAVTQPPQPPQPGPGRLVGSPPPPPPPAFTTGVLTAADKATTQQAPAAAAASILTAGTAAAATLTAGDKKTGGPG